MSGRCACPWAGASAPTAAACGGENAASFELGPGVLRPDGTVFYAGANACGAGNTAIYDTHRRTWRAGPQFPGGNDVADGPAALEPNGKVLVMASPGIFNTPATFFEWNGSSLSTVPGTPNAPIDSSVLRQHARLAHRTDPAHRLLE